MSAGTVNLRYLVLGLLTQEPMSGYDIKCFLKGLSWLIGSPSSGSLYPVLRALLEDGLASVEVVPGVDRPPRKIYSISQRGCESLQAWLDQPVVADMPLKAFVMRLLLADGLSPNLLSAFLRRRSRQVLGHQASLQEMVAGLDGGGGLGQRLALGYALALASAEVAWLDDALGALPERPPT